MSTRHRRSRGGKELRHVRVYHYVMQSPAWLDLDAVSRSIYLMLLARYAGTNTNNGKLPFSVREAASALKCSPNSKATISIGTASRALANLEAHGFIVPTTKGGFNQKVNGKVRRATEWRLTEFPCDVTNTLAGSKDFMKWAATCAASGTQAPVLCPPRGTPPYGNNSGVHVGILSGVKVGSDSSRGDTVACHLSNSSSRGDTTRFSSGHVMYAQENRVINFPNGQPAEWATPVIEEVAPNCTGAA